MKNEGRVKRKPRNFLIEVFVFFFLFFLLNCDSGNGLIQNENSDGSLKTKNEKDIKWSTINNGEIKMSPNTKPYTSIDIQKDIDKDTDEHYKAVIFDAGSTGTRVYIYTYKIVKEQNNDDIKIFIPSLNFKMTPGLVYLLNKYFEHDKEEFELYFNKIKLFLNEHVKETERSSTVFIFRASGGFRLLSINISNKYINFLKKYFYEHFSEYLLIDELIVQVLSGKEEAILSFVSINALLKRFTHNPLVFPQTEKKENENYPVSEHSDIQENEKKSSNNNDMSISHNEMGSDDSGCAAVVEIGGASAQIVVQLPLSKINDDISNFFNYKSKENNNKILVKENYKKKNIVKIKLFHQDIFLYCKSYLVLGRQNIMKTYLHYVVHTNNKKRGKVKKFIPVSCFPKNFKFHIDKLFKTSIEEDIYEYNQHKILDKNEYIGVGTGNIDQCRKELQIVLNHSQIESLPFKLKKFIKIYAIENFHHFVTDILNIPDDYNPLLIDTDMYLKKAEELCPSTIDEIIKAINPSANLEKAQTSCFGLLFLYEFLRRVFEIDNSIQIYSSNYVNNISITWTIAVLLMELPAYFDLIKERKEQEKNHKYYQDEL